MPLSHTSKLLCVTKPRRFMTQVCQAAAIFHAELRYSSPNVQRTLACSEHLSLNTSLRSPQGRQTSYINDSFVGLQAQNLFSSLIPHLKKWGPYAQDGKIRNHHINTNTYESPKLKTYFDTDNDSFNFKSKRRNSLDFNP